MCFIALWAHPMLNMLSTYVLILIIEHLFKFICVRIYICMFVCMYVCIRRSC